MYDAKPGQSRPIVIAARRGELSYLLINHLAERYDVEHVVFEASRPTRLLRYRLQRLGPATVAGQLLMHVWDRAVVRTRSQAHNRDLLRGYDIRRPDGRLPTTDVRSVNGPAFADLIEEIRPWVVVVSGTGIIAPRVLSLGPIFLNIHCGITPDYRGVHGGFWAIAAGRPDLVGTTVHVIDPGVDTGPIVAQRIVDVDPWCDTMRTLTTKQYLAGLEPMAVAVADALAGRLRTKPDAPHPGRQWFSPTLTDHRRFRKCLTAMRTDGGGRPVWRDPEPRR
ncbi:MAG: formyl transferase [Actinobacteria bacterium]|nr:formyl transferase [Actinomycetota bacterium]